MEVNEYRAKERPEKIINELLRDADNAMKVDCADPRVRFVVDGYFVFPKGSLAKPVDAPA